jgi:hypothetical protein
MSKADVNMYEKDGHGPVKHEEDLRSTPSPQQGVAVSLIHFDQVKTLYSGCT